MSDMPNHKLAKKSAPYRYKNRFFNHPAECKQVVPSNAWQILSDAVYNRAKFARQKFDHWWEQYNVVLRSIEPRVTWIGHASFLIQIGNLNILTDPIFGNLPFYPRILRPGIAMNELPPIDIVLISHNHLDHMDANSLLALKKHQGVSILVPWGDKAWFDARGFERVHEHIWWDQFVSDGHDLSFTFLPAKHWSQRSVFDRNQSLWGSWMIEYQGYKIYFAGDTAYGDHFNQIGAEFTDLDLALMPIAPCEPNEHMRRAHVNAQEAGQGFLDLGARDFIPMHWGTYYFGEDTFEGPIQRLKQWWEQKKDFLKDQQLHILRCGQYGQFQLTLPDIAPIEQPTIQESHF